MKYSIFLSIPTNADHVLIEKALAGLAGTFDKGMLSFVFADGLGYTEAYSGYMLMVSEKIFESAWTYVTAIDDHSSITLSRNEAGRVKAVYHNDTLSKIEEIEPSIYRRGTLN